MMSELQKFMHFFKLMDEVQTHLYEKYISVDLQICANKYPKKWAIQLLKITFSNKQEQKFEPIYSTDKNSVIYRRIMNSNSFKSLIKEQNGRITFIFEDITLTFFTNMIQEENLAITHANSL